MENKKELYISGQEAGPEEVSLKEKGRDTWGKSGSRTGGACGYVLKTAWLCLSQRSPLWLEQGKQRRWLKMKFEGILKGF